MNKNTTSRGLAILVAIALAFVFAFTTILVPASAKDSSKDIETLMKLQEAMTMELASMRGRLDAMEMVIGDIQSRLPPRQPNKN